MRGDVVMWKVDSWPFFAWSFLIVKLFHFLQYRILVESASHCMTRWTRHLNDWPTWIKENYIFFELTALLAIHGRFWSFRFHCLLSALLCCSNMCTQVSSSVSKSEIARLLQPLYVFKSSRAHLRRCVFCSSVSKWGTHLAQTFLRSKRFFRIVCKLPSDMPVQLAISLTDNCASCSTTIFTAAMLALVTEV